MSLPTYTISNLSTCTYLYQVESIFHHDLFVSLRIGYLYNMYLLAGRSSVLEQVKGYSKGSFTRLDMFLHCPVDALSKIIPAKQETFPFQ